MFSFEKSRERPWEFWKIEIFENYGNSDFEESTMHTLSEVNIEHGVPRNDFGRANAFAK